MHMAADSFQERGLHMSTVRPTAVPDNGIQYPTPPPPLPHRVAAWLTPEIERRRGSCTVPCFLAKTP
jgi:hypothetical protein